MAGIDLNRTWDSPSSMRHPTIYWTKELVKRQKKIRKILVVCDFHGHSRKEGVFMYGCSKDGIAIYSNNEKVKSKTPEVNTLPKIMHGKSNFFKMEYCNFNTMNCKAPTMRIVMFKEFDIPYSYSMETSLGGIHGEHFNTKHLRVRSRLELVIVSLYEMVLLFCLYTKRTLESIFALPFLTFPLLL